MLLETHLVVGKLLGSWSTNHLYSSHLRDNDQADNHS
jgi:hypothetical protein